MSSFNATKPNTARFSGYLAGTPLARALESKDECLQAAAAALIPVHAILSARSQAKVAADAMDALKKLSGNSTDFHWNGTTPALLWIAVTWSSCHRHLYSRNGIFGMCASFTTEGSALCASA